MITITDEAVKAASQKLASVLVGHGYEAKWGELADVVHLALEAALPHLSQEAVSVKPLEWEAIGSRDLISDTELGQYVINRDPYSAGGFFNLWMAGADEDTSSECPTLREAKAAAQADYERRILSALSPAPVGEADGVISAASDLLASIDPETLNPEQFNAWSALADALFSHEPAPVGVTDDDLINRLRYRVNNPSAWVAFDQEGSDLFEEAASRLEALASHERAADRKFKLGDRVTKTKGSSWTGHIVGFYSTSLTPIGYAVESENEPGSVQIYPEAALTALPDREGEGDLAPTDMGKRYHEPERDPQHFTLTGSQERKELGYDAHGTLTTFDVRDEDEKGEVVLEVVAWKTPFFEAGRSGQMIPIFADGDATPGDEEWIPLTSLSDARSALTTCQQEVERLRHGLSNIRELNMSGSDENGHRWAHSDLIEQEIVFALGGQSNE